jgi:hypothetical protein
MWAGVSALFRDLLVNYGAAQLGALGAAFVFAAWLAFALLKREPLRRFRLRKRSMVDALFVYGAVFVVSGTAGIAIWFSVGRWNPTLTKPLDAKDVAEEVVRRLPSPVPGPILLLAPPKLHQFRWVPLDHLQVLFEPLVVMNTSAPGGPALEQTPARFGVKNLGRAPVQNVRLEWSFPEGKTAEIFGSSPYLQRFHPSVRGAAFTLVGALGSFDAYPQDSEIVTIPYLNASGQDNDVHEMDLPESIRQALCLRLIAVQPRPTAGSGGYTSGFGPTMMVSIRYRSVHGTESVRRLIRSTVSALGNAQREGSLHVKQEHRATENLIGYIKFFVVDEGDTSELPMPMRTVASGTLDLRDKRPTPPDDAPSPQEPQSPPGATHDR